MRKFLITLFVLWQLFIALYIVLTEARMNNLHASDLRLNKVALMLTDEYCQKESQPDAQ